MWDKILHAMAISVITILAYIAAVWVTMMFINFVTMTMEVHCQ